MITVTAAIIEKDGKILIARRNKNDPLKGKWEFPGGRLEPGESLEECLKRELREELGIDAQIGEFVGSNTHRYEHISIELLAFRVKEYAGELHPTDHEEVKWVALSEFHKYDFPEADKPIIETLLK
jgi:8-oxo-dGTP diphosphatase